MQRLNACQQSSSIIQYDTVCTNDAARPDPRRLNSQTQSHRFVALQHRSALKSQKAVQLQLRSIALTLQSLCHYAPTASLD